MKKILYPIALAVLFTACAEKKSDLEKAKAKKETLNTKIGELKDKVRELDVEIKDLDTTASDGKIPVSVELLQKTDFTSYVEVHGVIQSNQTVTVMPELSGVIKRIVVREGQKVRKGQALAYLDTDLINKQIQELQKSLELAVQIYEKQKSMHEQNVGTEVQYLEAKNRKESIEQSIQTAKVQRRKAVVTSPVSGKIDEIYPNSGEMASPGSAFARIVNTADVYVNSDVSEALYHKIEENDEVVLRLLDDKNQTIQSKVTYKGNYINPANRTFKIHSELKGMAFPPNMLVAVKIVDLDMKGVYTVPRLLIQSDSKGYYVYEIVEKEGKKVAQKLHIKVVTSYGGNTVIESDEITSKTMIVNHGYKGLDVGAEVKVGK
jgi:membrane fusion protein (multidrug efflux system)